MLKINKQSFLGYRHVLRGSSHASRRRWARSVVVALLASFSAFRPAHAAIRTWNGLIGDGLWSSPGNWTPFGAPVDGDQLTIAGTNPTNQTVLYDFIGPPPIITTLTISRSNTNLTFNDPTLNMSDNFLTVISLFLGDATSGGSRHRGHFNQSGGSVVATTITMGNLALDSGSYVLTGGTGNVTHTYVGQSGGGVFTQSGGTYTIGDLHLGANPTGVGTFNLSGGTLTGSTPLEIIGNQGTGTFNQSGGLNNMPGSNSTVWIGFDPGSTGTYNLGGGTFSISPQAYFGFKGNAIVNHSAGTLTSVFTGGTLALASATSSTATYALSGSGAISFSAKREIIGDAGNATFTQSGGTHLNASTGSSGSAVSMLVIASASTSTSTYNLSGGSLTLTAGQSYVGYNGTGTFNQSGGLFTINFTNNLSTPALFIANSTGSTGTYNLSGGSLALNNAYLIVGSRGAGTFNQSAGVLSVTSTIGAGAVIDLANAAGSTGRFNLSGGSVTATNLYVGSGGPATFNHTSGVFVLNGAAGFSVINGAYTLSGSGILTSAEGQEFLDGTASVTSQFNQTGGTHTLSGTFFASLNIGRTVGGSGIYRLNGGVLSAKNIYVAGSSSGPGGTGTFTLNTVNTLALSGAMTVYPAGLVNGTGSTAATVLLQGTLAPGNGNDYFTANGALTFGGLTINAGSRIYLKDNFFNANPDDVLHVTNSNALNLAGSSMIILNGYFPAGKPLITYSTNLSGSIGNLTLFGGNSELAYIPLNDTTSHIITYTTKVIAHHTQVNTSGTPAPGAGGGFLNQFTIVQPNLSPTSGQVAFYSGFLGSTDSSFAGIFRGDGASLIAIARQNQSVPGVGGGIFSDFAGTSGPSINAAGQIAFQASFTGTVDGSSSGLFRYDPVSGLSNIARDLQFIPGFPGQTLGTIVLSNNSAALSSLNPSGRVAFVAGINNATNGALAGVFVAGGPSLVSIARHKQSAPGAGGGLFDATFSPQVGNITLPGINASAQVAFAARLTSTSDGSTTGIFRGDGASLVSIAREKDFAPGSGGGTFGPGFRPNGDFDPPLFINDAGQVAFANTNLVGTSDGSTQGLFRGDGTSVIVIAREKRPAPGTGAGTFGGISGAFSAPVMNNAGQVAFASRLTGTTNSSDFGWFRSDGSSLIAIARALQSAPGTGGGVFANHAGVPDTISPVAIGPGGQVAFTAEVTGTPDAAFHSGLFLGDGQEIINAALTGQVLPTLLSSPYQGRTSAFIIGPNSVNQYGQVAYYPIFEYSGSGNYVFTPVLHWRTAGSGAWDTNTNWTVSLAPAFVHDVVIDPATSLTITGPAANTQLKSLTLGGNAGVPAVQLTTGSIKLAENLTLIGAPNAWLGKIDINARALAIQTASPADKAAKLAILANQINSGYAGGTWLGNGITSTAVKNDPGPNTTIALADNADLHLPSFMGLALDDNSIILARQLLGDADLSTVVDAADFDIWFRNVGASTFSYTRADFDHSGIIDAADFDIWFRHVGLSGLPPALLSETPSAPKNSIASPVPEPVSLAVLTLVIPCFFRRRQLSLANNHGQIN